MTFASLLRHTVVIERRVAVLDGGLPTYDAMGQPVTVMEEQGEWRCRIQALTSREVAQLSEAGAAISDHRIFGYPVDLQPGDRLVAADGREFEVKGLPEDAGGSGHHYEVQVQRIESEDVAEPAAS